MKEAHRAYIYRIALALSPVAVFYGLLAQNEAALWIGVLGAILGTGGHALATANTSTAPAAELRVAGGVLTMDGSISAAEASELAGLWRAIRRSPTIPTAKMLHEAANILETAPYARTSTAAWLRELAAAQLDTLGEDEPDEDARAGYRAGDEPEWDRYPGPLGS